MFAAPAGGMPAPGWCRTVLSTRRGNAIRSVQPGCGPICDTAANPPRTSGPRARGARQARGLARSNLESPVSRSAADVVGPTPAHAALVLAAPWSCVHCALIRSAGSATASRVDDPNPRRCRGAVRPGSWADAGAEGLGRCDRGLLPTPRLAATVRGAIVWGLSCTGGRRMERWPLTAPLMVYVCRGQVAGFSP